MRSKNRTPSVPKALELSTRTIPIHCTLLLSARSACMPPPGPPGHRGAGQSAFISFPNLRSTLEHVPSCQPGPVVRNRLALLDRLGLFLKNEVSQSFSPQIAPSAVNGHDPNRSPGVRAVLASSCAVNCFIRYH